jgi:hypothetical protein
MERRQFLLAGALIAIILGVVVGARISGLLGVGFGIPTPSLVAASDPSGTYQTSGQSNQWSFVQKTLCSDQADYGVLRDKVQYLRICADVNLQISVQASALGSPTRVTNQTTIFKCLQSTPSPCYAPKSNVTVYMIDNYQVYSYSFKITTQYSGTINFREDSFLSCQTLLAVGCRALNDFRVTVVQAVIAQINSLVYEQNANLVWDLNAPTLANKPILSPGYVGLMGLFLQDYQLGGYSQGSAAQLLPNAVGTPVQLCLVNQFPCPQIAFSLSNPTPTNYAAPAQMIFYPQNFAAQYAYWQTSIVNIGSTITLLQTNAYPNWWAWSSTVNQIPNFSPNAPACSLPCVAQWFRADTLQLLTTPLEIPNYQVSQDQRDKQSIVVPSAPTNPGTPGPPPVPWQQAIISFFNGLWNYLQYIIIAAVIILVLLVAFRFASGGGGGPKVVIGRSD